jgi:AAA+ superfamily predicted ATPase
MLLAMTQHYIKKPKLGSAIKEKVGSVDPLPNKGKGSIILLYGPPGTGKTLTVESLAEKMECPLWQLSISTLQMKPKKLETRLMKKFEVATLWGAIMLLDEADVYLSPRKYSPLASDASQGNALTGVFLRILEYYKGILFLTTNQIDHFEPAIYSRISLFLKYEEFNYDQRRQLWSHFMKRVGIESATSTFWKEVLPIQLNGRFIRNIVSNAEILCESQEKQLNEDHILDALRLMPLATTKGLFTIEEKPEERDGQDSMSIGGSLSTHDQWSSSE